MTITLLACLFLSVLLYLSVATDEKGRGLQEAREKAGKDVIAMRDESLKPDFTTSAEWESRWNKVNEDYNAALSAEEKYEAEVARKAQTEDAARRIHADAERMGALRRGRLRPDYDPGRDPRSAGGSTGFPSAQEWGRALRAWCGSRAPDYDPEEADTLALRRCRANVMSDEFRLPAGPAIVAMVMEMQEVFAEYHPSMRGRAIREVLASWNTMTPESAAYVAQPPTILRELEVNRLAWGGLLQVATVRQTTTGEDILLPFTDDTSVKGRRIAEDGPIGVENVPKFGQIRWGAYKYTSDVIPVTYEMTRDTFVDLEGYIGSTGGIRLGKIENKECTTGTGNSMPRGLIFAAPVGVTAAAQTVVTTDEIIDLEMSVDDAYQQGDRVGYMLSKNALKMLRKLKDLQGRPFYVLGQETGGRDRLNNKPVFLNYDMDNPTAGKKPIAYGDYSKYWIRRVGGTRLVRDPYTQLISNDRQLYAAVEYMDGNLINAGTAPVKVLQMAP